MATKKKKKKQKQVSARSNSMMPVLVAIVIIVALIGFAMVLVEKIPPVFIFVVLAILSYPTVVWYLRLLNRFAACPSSALIYVPFLGESSCFLTRWMEIAHNVLLLLCAILFVSMVGGNYVSFLSIPQNLGSLLYGGETMNNGAVLQLFVYQTYFLLGCYALLCLVRGIAYVQIDNFIAREDSRIYLEHSSRRNRSASQRPQAKNMAEWVTVVFYFIPVVRALGIVYAGQRLNKLVVLNDMSVQSKTRAARVTVEMEDDIV